ncbi:hypothetical protein BH18ACT5_BH18ACT5_01460 [soil metagenome]
MAGPYCDREVSDPFLVMDRHITAGESGRRVDREVSGPLGGLGRLRGDGQRPTPRLFRPTKAISFAVNWKDQAEVDYYWGQLPAAPESEQSGWFWTNSGSRRIVPTALYKMLTMKELDNAGLEKAAALG